MLDRHRIRRRAGSGGQARRHPDTGTARNPAATTPDVAANLPRCTDLRTPRPQPRPQPQRHYRAIRMVEALPLLQRRRRICRHNGTIRNLKPPTSQANRRTSLPLRPNLLIPMRYESTEDYLESSEDHRQDCVFYRFKSKP